MDFLKNNQKQEIRAEIGGDIVLYEPTQEQIEELKNILKELEIENQGKDNVEMPIKYIRYIIRNLCKNGAFIDEYSDDDIYNSFTDKANLNLIKFKYEIEKILNEINELMLIEQTELIQTYTQMINILNSNIELNNMKNKFEKLFKKNGYDISFEEVVNGNIDLNNLSEYKKKNKKRK